MKKFSALLCTVFSGIAINTMAQNSVSLPDIATDPGPVTVQVNYDFTVDDVYSFEIQIEYDPAKLSYLGHSAGDIPDDADFHINETEPGSIEIAWSKLSGRDDAGVLVYLDFTHAGTGEITTPLTFSETNYSTGNENPLNDPSWLADGGDPVRVLASTFTNGSITFSATPVLVPLPAWAVLLTVALVATFAVIRFFRLQT